MFHQKCQTNSGKHLKMVSDEQAFLESKQMKWNKNSRDCPGEPYLVRVQQSYGRVSDFVIPPDSWHITASFIHMWHTVTLVGLLIDFGESFQTLQHHFLQFILHSPVVSVNMLQTCLLMFNFHTLERRYSRITRYLLFFSHRTGELSSLCPTDNHAFSTRFS